MIEIKDLLAKYDKFLFSEENKRESARLSISESLGIKIKPQEINVKNGTVYLDIKPIYKNEILIKKEKILKNLEKYFGKKSPKDVR